MNYIQMLQNRLKRETLYCTSQYWDSKAEAYQHHSVSMWPNNNLNNYYHTEQLQNLKRYLSNVKGMSVLDVGCGTGRLSRYLAENGAQVLGLDFSEKSVAIARSLSNGDNPNYLVQSVFDLSDETVFDIIISWGTLTVACRNQRELELVMSRLFNALNPGGKILLMEPVHKGFLHRVLNVDIRKFCQVMEEAGFKVKEVRHLHCWPVRMILAFWNWPKVITSIGYYLGEAMLFLTRHKALGDYHSIYADKSP
jgi:2-polyprenyl-3-methyl-5-hydroxy-6-metoxy-1,4-benzoquinol methylase